MSLYDMAAHRLARPCKPKVEQPKPAKVIDIRTGTYDATMRRIQRELAEWHRQLEQAMREGLE